MVECFGVYGDGFLLDIVYSVEKGRELYTENDIVFIEGFTSDGLSFHRKLL